MASTTSAPASATPMRILIINPNTTSSMTDLLPPLISTLSLPSDSLAPSFFTCPSPGIPSINSPNDSAKSAEHCLPHLMSLLPHHDAFLIACYSQHPLVSAIQSESQKLTASSTSHGTGARKYVTGIFESSVLTSLSLLHPNQSFGIVSTGKVWETALPDAVRQLLGAEASSKFAGCETTGLNADQLHALPAEEVKGKMMDATKRLLRKGKMDGEGNKETGGVGAICLGCAGMVGLDDAVRIACIEELGEESGKMVHIVDGVKAGILQLYGMARGAF